MMMTMAMVIIMIHYYTRIKMKAQIGFFVENLCQMANREGVREWGSVDGGRPR